MIVKLIWVPSGSLFLMLGAFLPWIGQCVFESKAPEGLPALQEARVSVSVLACQSDPPPLSRDAEVMPHMLMMPDRVHTLMRKFWKVATELSFGWLVLSAPWGRFKEGFSTPSNRGELIIYILALGSPQFCTEVSPLFLPVVFKAFSACQLKAVVNDSAVTENMHLLVK